MKKLLLTLLIATSLSSFGQNLIHHYTMNKINNSLGSDYYRDRVNGANLTPQNSTTTYPRPMTGVRDTALDKSAHFEGNLALIASSTTDNRNWTGAAYSVWVRTNTTSTDMEIIQFPYGGYAMGINPNGKVVAHFDASSAGQLVSNKSVNDGLWHHLVAYNNGTNTFIYIDGVYDNAQAETLFTPSSVNPDAKLRVGATRFVNAEFIGQIDEVRMYDGILTNAQVTALYNQTRQGAYLYEELDYKFDGSFVDSSLHQRNLQNNNGNRFTFGKGQTSDPGDSALYAGASNASIKSVDPINNINWGSAAVSVWLKKCRNGFIYLGYRTGYGLKASSSGNLEAYFDGSGAGALVTSATAAVLDTNWHHVVAQNDGDSSYIYIDGTLNVKQAESYFAQSSNLEDHNFMIASGAYPQGTPPQPRYYEFLQDGYIDDLKLFSNSLSSSEINTLYQAGVATGVKELPHLQVQEFNISPNPANNFINLPEEVYNADMVKVFNVNGQVVQETAGAQKINVSGLDNGMYFLYVTKGDQIFRSKFLKN